MKIKLKLVNRAALVVLLPTLNPQLSILHAQGTAFTYQGRLNDGANPANGRYDFQFTLYDAASGPGALGASPQPGIGVTNGLFMVQMDLGAAAFTGPDRWLEIAVHTNGASSYSTLAPRQKLTPTPYAITAGNLTGVVPSAGVAGTYSGAVTFNNPADSFSGNGAGLTNVNATTLNGFGYCSLPCYWNLTGNAGTTPGIDFVGTTDNQPLTLGVNNTIALRYVPGATLPNIVGGLAGLRPTVLATGISGAVVAGGNAPSGGFDGAGAGDFMAAYDDDVTIGGGFGNKAGSDDGDPTDAAFATVGGGIFNVATNFAATVGGGAANLAGGSRAVVAGGNGNQAIGNYSFIGGGINNTASGDYAAVGGGYQNSNSGVYATVSGGGANTIQPNSDIATIGGGHNNTIQSAAFSMIGGGGYNTIQTNAYDSAIGGGGYNTIETNAHSSAIGGGLNNTIQPNAAYAMIPGGYGNVAGGDYSFAAGQQAQALHQGSFVWADSENAAFASTVSDSFNVRAKGGVQLVTSGAGVSIDGPIRLNSTGGYSQSSVGNFSVDAPFIPGGRFTVLTNGNVGIGNTNPTNKLMVVNARCDGSSWINASDRNLKQGFAGVDAQAVLARVAALPVTTWSYKAQPEQKHLGPVAQDFHAAFGLGADEVSIATVDESGVALAAIQGLNQKVEEQRAENANLKQRLEQLEQLINQMNRGAK